MSILRQLQTIQAQSEISTIESDGLEIVDPNNLPKGYARLEKKDKQVISSKQIKAIELNGENSFSVTFNAQRYDKLVLATEIHTVIKKLLMEYQSKKPNKLSMNYVNLRDLLKLNNGKLVIQTRKLKTGHVKATELNRAKTDFQENFFGRKENADRCNRYKALDDYADFFTCDLSDIVGIWINNRAIFTTVAIETTSKHAKQLSNNRHLTFEKLGYDTAFYVKVSANHKWHKYACSDDYLTFKLRILANGDVIAKLNNTCLEQKIGRFLEAKNVTIRNDVMLFTSDLAFVPVKSMFSALLDAKLNHRLMVIADDIKSLLGGDQTRHNKDLKICRNNLRRILEDHCNPVKLEDCLKITCRYKHSFLVGYLLDKYCDNSLLIVKKFTLEMKHGDHTSIKQTLIRLTNNVKLTL